METIKVWDPRIISLNTKRKKDQVMFITLLIISWFYCIFLPYRQWWIFKGWIWKLQRYWLLELYLRLFCVLDLIFAYDFYLCDWKASANPYKRINPDFLVYNFNAQKEKKIQVMFISMLTISWFYYNFLSHRKWWIFKGWIWKLPRYWLLEFYFVCFFLS